MYIVADDNNNIQFFTGNENSLIITNGGNTGIGTSNPDCKLDVRGSNRIQLKEDGTGHSIAMRTDGTVLDLTFEGASLAIQGTSAGEDVLFNPAMNSNIGIGKWIPTEKLDVNGNIKSSRNVNVGGILQLSSGGVSMYESTSTDDTEVNLAITGPHSFCALSSIAYTVASSTERKCDVSGTVGGSWSLTAKSGNTQSIICKCYCFQSNS